jgi:magnesium chelatase family protein
MDRIDLQVLVEPVDPNQLRDQSLGETSGEIRKRVIRARNPQKERFQNTTIFANAQMQASDLRTYCQLDQSAENMLRHAIEQLNLSARAHDRLLKVSRTIADLAEQKNIQVNHLAEAIQYRQLDRLWQM